MSEKWAIPTLKSWHFEASEDIMAKSQAFHVIRIKYWNASGSGNPPSLNPTLWNIGILHYKQAKLCKHLQHSVLLNYAQPASNVGGLVIKIELQVNWLDSTYIAIIRNNLCIISISLVHTCSS